MSKKHETTFKTLSDNLKWRLDLLRQIEELKGQIRIAETQASDVLTDLCCDNVSAYIDWLHGRRPECQSRIRAALDWERTNPGWKVTGKRVLGVKRRAEK
jgi:hypothetical protein